MHKCTCKIYNRLYQKKKINVFVPNMKSSFFFFKGMIIMLTMVPHITVIYQNTVSRDNYSYINLSINSVIQLYLSIYQFIHHHTLLFIIYIYLFMFLTMCHNKDCISFEPFPTLFYNFAVSFPIIFRVHLIKDLTASIVFFLAFFCWTTRIKNNKHPFP